MARTPRNEAVRSERRHRDAGTLDRLQRNKLALPVAFRDTPGWAYRWVNDDGTRIHDLTVEGEYDVCTTTNSETGTEDQVRKPVGRKDTGEPLYAYLCRQPQQFADEDLKAKVARTDEMQKQVLSSATPAPEDNRSGDTAYIAGTPTIRRGHGAAKPYTP